MIVLTQGSVQNLLIRFCVLRFWNMFTIQKNLPQSLIENKAGMLFLPFQCPGDAMQSLTTTIDLQNIHLKRYYAPEAASGAVNSVYDNVEAWWNNPDRQAARRNFANTSSNVVNQWANEFTRIAKTKT